eukprot:TRINITY_DN66649_c0_g1_i1.p1 TRINITY_DN66649_c0_g1~~TRINITY_DN66649_c0_g1_i1.p1  ORF type:complete len:102 (+),score=11.58 TRINITY_DN66649_c0_g1_i1:278-583(+)
MLPGAALMAALAWTCLQSAMKCHHCQRNHIMLLASLKRALTSDRPEQQRAVMAIDRSVEVMETRDYQTKLMFFPLNPKVIAALGTYFGTAGVSIIYSIVQG